MEKSISFRNLNADEIDVRINTINEKGMTLLLYKDARCDMKILDETIGPFNWQRKHLRDNQNCIVSIWDENKNQWIEKEDTGKESFTEKEKGLASDSFKRACFNWGIGIELYTKIFLYIKPESDKEIFKNKNGKHMTYTKFNVKYILTSKDKVILGLVIKDEKNKIRVKYFNEELYKEKLKENKVEKISDKLEKFFGLGKVMDNE